jgi:hypothetical protein
VLVNLVGNAIKFTDRGGRVAVEVTPVEGEGGGAVRVSVVDSGVGIPPEELDTIFEKFHQVDGNAQLAPLGTGLGLSICRELVVAHHGRIWAESDPGRGSRFSFVIPSLSPCELLLRALSSAIERAQRRDEPMSFVLARVANREELRERGSAEELESAMGALLGATRRVVRRSSDRVVPYGEALEVGVILSRTAVDGGRAFGTRLQEEFSSTPLKVEGVLLSVSAVEYPRDGRTAGELYERASDKVHEPTVA